MQSTTKLCFCLAGDEISSSVKRNSYTEEERQALLVFKQHLVDHSGRLSSWMVMIVVNGKAFHATTALVMS